MSEKLEGQEWEECNLTPQSSSLHTQTSLSIISAFAPVKWSIPLESMSRDELWKYLAVDLHGRYEEIEKYLGTMIKETANIGLTGEVNQMGFDSLWLFPSITASFRNLFNNLQARFPDKDTSKELQLELVRETEWVIELLQAFVKTANTHTPLVKNEIFEQVFDIYKDQQHPKHRHKEWPAVVEYMIAVGKFTWWEQQKEAVMHRFERENDAI